MTSIKKKGHLLSRSTPLSMVVSEARKLVLCLNYHTRNYLYFVGNLNISSFVNNSTFLKNINKPTKHKCLSLFDNYLGRVVSFT